MIKGFRRRLRARQRLLGPMIQIASPAIVEIAAAAGADYVVLDTEHGEYDLAEIPALVRAADAGGVASIVKLRTLDESAIGKVLDVGANGVVLPDITTAEQAERCVRAAKYLPQGARGGAPMTRATAYSSVAWRDYVTSANEETTVWVKVEGVYAIRDAARIAAVAGLDLLSIGPFDLSQALGIPGEYDHPRLLQSIRDIAAAARGAGCAVGSFAPDAKSVDRWAALGLTVFNLSVDISVVFNAMQELYREARIERAADTVATTHERKGPRS